MDTTERLLRTLSLLSARPWWSGPDLAARLEVTERTVRRDMARLRAAGYPVEAVTGPYGGYRLGAGARLPPLVLDDDEAVAVALSLRTAAGHGAPGIESAALSALTKLDQVLPAGLRSRVSAIGSVTVGLHDRAVPAAETDTLVTVAVACERSERVRFTYVAGTGEQTSRLVEPFRLVHTDRRWYLVAYDPSRTDWRTFRIDRISELRETHQRFQRHDPPDPAAFVASGIAFAGWDVIASVRVEAPIADVTPYVTPIDGTLTAESDTTTMLSIGGDDEWIARFLARLPFGFEVLEPDSVRAAICDLACVLLDRHGNRTVPPQRPTP